MFSWAFEFSYDDLNLIDLFDRMECNPQGNGLGGFVVAGLFIDSVEIEHLASYSEITHKGELQLLYPSLSKDEGTSGFPV